MQSMPRPTTGQRRHASFASASLPESTALTYHFLGLEKELSPSRDRSPQPDHRTSHRPTPSLQLGNAGPTSNFSRKGSVSSFRPLLAHTTSAASIETSPGKRTDSLRGQSLPRRPSGRQERPALKAANSYSGDPRSPVTSPSRDPAGVPAPRSNMLARPSTAHQVSGQTASLGMPVLPAPQPISPTLETITYQHIQEMVSKRISTLDYLRKAHEGRVYWFNTLLFNKPDLQRIPFFDSRKSARRATNYLLLGISLPTVLDLNGGSASEFLKTLLALLQEFDAYQQIHPADGASSSSLSRARIPQMFKRATINGSKGRRTSSAAESGLPYDAHDANNMANGINGTALANGDGELLPGEEYTHLLTPSLPFDPDFYETFATLCDVLIDCYTRLMTLVSSPRECNPQVAELFTKADARVRKIIVQGVVKEFEDSSRTGVKSEVAGVGRVVLGGLM